MYRSHDSVEFLRLIWHYDDGPTLWLTQKAHRFDVSLIDAELNIHTQWHVRADTFSAETKVLSSTIFTRNNRTGIEIFIKNKVSKRRYVKHKTVLRYPRFADRWEMLRINSTTLGIIPYQWRDMFELDSICSTKIERQIIYRISALLSLHINRDITWYIINFIGEMFRLDLYHTR